MLHITYPVSPSFSLLCKEITRCSLDVMNNLKNVRK